MGKVENIPGGVGVAEVPATPTPATTTSSASAPTARPIILPASLRPLFLFLTFQFFRVGNNLFCRTKPLTLQHYRADST